MIYTLNSIGNFFLLVSSNLNLIMIHYTLYLTNLFKITNIPCLGVSISISRIRDRENKILNS